jgi:hypothetical protein
MPALTTLAQLVLLNSTGIAPVEVSNVFQESPFLAMLAATTSSNGTNHKYLRQTSAPTVGFRAVNTGVATSVSEVEEVSIALQILHANVEVDQQIAKNFKSAVSGSGRDGYFAMQGLHALRSALQAAEKQVFNGTLDGNSSGFAGLSNALNALGSSSKLVLDAGGDTANGCTSIYAIRTTDSLEDVVAVGGDMTGSGAFDIQAGEIHESKIVTALGPPELTVPSYRMNQEGYFGLQIGSKYSVARAANIDEDTQVTATLVENLLDLGRSDRPFTHLVMNRRTGRWLARSLVTDLNTRVELLREFEGVPIVYTSNILLTEDEVTA